ncbi:MAG: Arm DNA-binding domain-containing protein [Mariprofundus sp.]|nr:Arm DNA-binding domain-containing protein [Mariprofundus sp.]
MALTDVKIKAAKVPEGKKQAKLADSGGLYLLVKASGKYWRLDYRFGDKRKTMAIGVYPQAKLDKHIFPWIGAHPITDIEAPDILAIVQLAEKRGTIETAHRLKMLCSRIFRYGIATGKVKYDPTVGLQGALMPLNVKHRETSPDPLRRDPLRFAFRFLRFIAPPLGF